MRDGVLFVMTVQNVDYAQLSLNTTLFGAFQASIRQAVAQALGPDVARPEDVTLTVSPGSAIVRTLVSPLHEGGARAVQDTLRRSKVPLIHAVEDALAALEGLNVVSTGMVRVGAVNDPELVAAGSSEAIAHEHQAASGIRPPRMQMRESVMFGITVDNVNFAQLSVHSHLFSNFEACIQRAVADALSLGVRPQDVTLALSSGSVLASALVTTSREGGALAIQEKLRKSPMALIHAVEQALAALEGLSAASTGVVRVGAVGDPEVMVAAGNMRGDTEDGRESDSIDCAEASENYKLAYLRLLRLKQELRSLLTSVACHSNSSSMAMQRRGGGAQEDDGQARQMLRARAQELEQTVQHLMTRLESSRQRLRDGRSLRAALREHLEAVVRRCRGDPIPQLAQSSSAGPSSGSL
jgi:SLT domain-containing protein